MGKVREFIGEVARISKNAEKIANYANDYETLSKEVEKLEKTSDDYEKTKEAFNSTLMALNASIAELNNHISKLDTNFASVNDKLGNLEATVNKQTKSLDSISISLQLELYQSLRNLRNRYVNRSPHGWASDAEKKVARDFYEKIHLLGQDGESESLWADIEKLPSNRAIY